MPTHGLNHRDPLASPQEGLILSSHPPQDKSASSLLGTCAIDRSSGIDTHSEIDSRRFQQSSSMSSSHQFQVINRLYNTGSSAIDDAIDPPANAASLSDVWSAIRQKKQLQMAKEKAKVQSLEEVVPAQLASGAPVQEEGPSVRIPVMESPISPMKAVKRQKSISTLRESSDGKSMVATFEMPTEIEKQDVHISFQRGRLVVTWVTVEVIEYEEDEGTVYRERFERSHHRTIPLPEGTKFEEVQAIMNGRRLSLRYPNMRCLRVEPQSRSGNS